MPKSTYWLGSILFFQTSKYCSSTTLDLGWNSATNALDGPLLCACILSHAGLISAFILGTETNDCCASSVVLCDTTRTRGISFPLSRKTLGPRDSHLWGTYNFLMSKMSQEVPLKMHPHNWWSLLIHWEQNCTQRLLTTKSKILIFTGFLQVPLCKGNLMFLLFRWISHMEVILNYCAFSYYRVGTCWWSGTCGCRCHYTTDSALQTSFCYLI